MTIETSRRERSGLRIAVGIAVAVVVLALLWLVVVLTVSGTSGWPTAGPLGVIAQLLFLVLLVGWIASVVGVVLAFVARARTGRRGMLVIALTLLPVAAVGAVAAAFVGLVVVSYAHPFVDNRAADAGRPLSAALRAHGGSELCTAADPGVGPDNVQPWYTAYLEVPSSTVSPDVQNRALEQAGFRPTAGGGTKGTATATVDVLGSSDVEIDCSSGFDQWGHHHTAAPGDVVLEVQVQLPARTD